MIYTTDELKMNCRYPEGEAGRQTLKRMNISHRPLTAWGLDQMTFGRRDAVLDVGCGGGMALQMTAERVPEGTFAGIDLSPLSIETAKELNADAVAAGTMTFEVASVEGLPFADRTFDRVITVESYYFWPDPDKALGEIVRVMKDGGQLMIALEYRSDMEKDEAYYYNTALLQMNVPDAASLTHACQAAGLSKLRAVTKGSWLCVVGEK